MGVEAEILSRLRVHQQDTPAGYLDTAFGGKSRFAIGSTAALLPATVETFSPSRPPKATRHGNLVAIVWPLLDTEIT